MSKKDKHMSFREIFAMGNILSPKIEKDIPKAVHHHQQLKTQKEIAEHRQKVLASFPTSVPIEIHPIDIAYKTDIPFSTESIQSFVELPTADGITASLMEIPKEKVEGYFDTLDKIKETLEISDTEYKNSRNALHSRVICEVTERLRDAHHDWILTSKVKTTKK